MWALEESHNFGYCELFLKHAVNDGVLGLATAATA